jgi:cytoskeleton protein RodZ
VWLATRAHLDVAAVAQDAAPLDLPASEQADAAAARRARAAQSPGPRPVVASLASLPAHEPATGGLTLRFNGESWIEVSGRDGRSLEQALVHAGDVRTYAPGEVGAVVLGNASVVEVRHDGRTADLAPYLRANVARFTVSSDGSLAPAAD